MQRGWDVRLVKKDYKQYLKWGIGAIILIIFLTSFKSCQKTLESKEYQPEERYATAEEVKTFIFEGDGTCSIGERRESVDCKITYDFGALFTCVFKADCKEKFISIIMWAIIIIIGLMFYKGYKKK